MNEKTRTVILLALLIFGLFILWYISREVDTNFTNQF